MIDLPSENTKYLKIKKRFQYIQESQEKKILNM